MVENTKYFFVIRGKNGMRFESCEVGKLGEEESYETYEQALIVLPQLQECIPFETLEIIREK